MLDVKYIVDHPDAVKKNAANKNERRADIDKILALHEQ
jgi:seryl-tRNA synthetase